ncbi:uncharacterized protein C8A04DRAFT_15178 [Dichotomopilus funicola]|uniref:Protein kinase domain-containing protein n=1 Tax=Dichotomopilus funicola TaxID=1934379 RepID=A0AAN6ZI78_9PEZI|nr:hypothetical protein C8A04DRAFT_15178 [Dichotomopilus funicola]
MAPVQYSHQTLVFYPLEVPEIAPQEHLNTSETSEDNESTQYLKARQRGFVFTRWLQSIDTSESDRPVVALYASLDRPQELVVIKKLCKIDRYLQAADNRHPMPAEIEQSTLSTTTHPYVQRQLPLYDHVNEGSTAFPQLYAFQIHELQPRDARGKAIVPGPDEPRQKDDITLFYKYYNGGTLGHLIQHYRDWTGGNIPEVFIWHVLAEVGRALCWLHTGYTPSRAYNLQHQNHIWQPNQPVNDARQGNPPPPQPWRPICHQDMHVFNIWLHYPTDAEKRADPSLERFTDTLPQIILGDFGMSFQEHNDRYGELRVAVNPGLPEPSTWKDKGELGRALLCMMVPSFNASEENLERQDGVEGTERFRVAPTNDIYQRGYSDDLVRCWMEMQRLVPTAIAATWDEMLMRSPRRTGEDWVDWPPNDFVFGTMIALADRYVDAYRRGDGARSVRWTQPSTACMPVKSKAEWNPLKRQHQEDVQADLEKMIEKYFSQHYNLNTECVQIQQAHIFGRKLERAMRGEWNPATGSDDDDTGHKKRKRVEEKKKDVEHGNKKARREEETPDDLLDFEDYQDTDLPEVHVGRATVHRVQRLTEEPLPVRLRDGEKERKRQTEKKEGLPIRVLKPEQ